VVALYLAQHYMDFLMLFNGHHRDITFVLPTPAFGEKWLKVLGTANGTTEEERPVKAGESLVVETLSLLLLRRT
jgi:pullulanase/glycogen debranching enzyme